MRINMTRYRTMVADVSARAERTAAVAAQRMHLGCVLVEVGLKRFDARILDEQFAAARRGLLYAPFAGIETNQDLPVRADLRAAALAEMVKLEAEVVQHVIPIDPAQAELRGTGLACLLRFDGKTIHEAAHQRRGVLRLSVAGAVVGVDQP